MIKTRSAAIAALFGIALLVLLSACGGGGGGGSAPAAATSTPTYTISGKVTVNGAGLGQVVLTLGDGTTATSQGTGDYSFTVGSGSYTVTPSLAGYTFTPASQSVTVGSSSVTADFTATALPTYAISGKVLAANGAGLAGATVSMTKTAAGATPITVISGADGSYLRGGLLAGDYLVTVSHPTGGTFTPASQTVTVTAGIATANFASSAAATHTIAGKVTLPDGTAKGQVPLVLTIETSSTTFSTVTDNSGTFAFSGLPDGDYVIHPGPVSGFYFYPDPLLVRIAGADKSSQNIGIVPAGTASLGGTPTTSP